MIFSCSNIGTSFKLAFITYGEGDMESFLEGRQSFSPVTIRGDGGAMKFMSRLERKGEVIQNVHFT